VSNKSLESDMFLDAVQQSISEILGSI